MKILFVAPEILLSEPIGLMQLSAICKKNGHQTKLVLLKKQSIIKTLAEYNPQIIAYSAMTPDIDLFIEADNLIRSWLRNNNKSVVRIMGGPHPTYFPEILEQNQLDAICIGEGDNAILNMIKRVEGEKDFLNIPNVLSSGGLGFSQKELITDLDSLPFIDREIIYEAAPHYRTATLRSFLTSRGCPYRCTYCYNHVFNNMFQGLGKILRRRSVDHVIEEIKYVIKNYPPVRFIRFADDTFAHQVDQWLLEFLGRYQKEIKMPFYCLMRSNVLTEEMAKLLAQAGCKSIGMAVETGDEKTRNQVLKRNLSDKIVKESFDYARKYNIKTYGNTMLGIPGTTLKEDFDSFLFTKNLKLSAPTFGIFSPYPGTELTEYAIENGFLDKNFNFRTKFGLKSVLSCYTEKERDWQIRLAYLAPIFAALPNFFIRFLKILLKLRLTKLYSLIGGIYVSYRTYFKIFPHTLPSQPLSLLRIVRGAIRYSQPKSVDSISS